MQSRKRIDSKLDITNRITSLYTILYILNIGLDINDGLIIYRQS